MAMQMADAKEGEPVPDINTTPLIDILLVLLIMIMTTLPPQHHGVKIDTPFPCADCPERNPLEPILITVDFDGSYAWNGAPTDRATLDRWLAGEAQRDPDAEVHILPDRLARYEYVIHVMASAQRVGLTRIGVLRAS
jgi:biopolymer transport protein ExbD